MSDNYSNEFDSLFEEPTLSASQRKEIEKIASETLVRGYQALQQGAAVVQRMTAEAVRKTEEARPGFVERYQSPEICRKFIEQRPAVARAILNAESGMGTDSLPELYEIFDETTRNWEPENRGAEPRDGAPASTLSLQQINALRPEERREPISKLLAKVGDRSIDEADTSNTNETFWRERGE